MKNSLAAVLCLAVLTAGIGCRKAETSRKTPETGSGRIAEARFVGDTITFAPGSPLLDRIEVEAVRSAVLSLNEVSAPGRIEFDAGRVVRVHLPVPGRVESVLVRQGDAVKAGQPLLTIDSPDAGEAVSAYRQAAAALTQARATLVRATADRDRTADLFAHKAAAEKEVLAAENDLALARAAADQAEAAREQARRRLDILGLGEGEAGSRVTINAPLRGKVIELGVTAGEYRNDGSEPAMTVADLSTVWVTSDIPESSIRLIEVGERIQVEMVAYPGEIFEARVTRIADILDPRTRTVQVRAELANPSGRLRPEMFGRIRHMHPAKPGPVIPARAVYRRGAETWVFVERGPGEFQRVPVRLGASSGDPLPVLEGLRPGDRIVAGGVMLLAGLEAR